MNKTEIELKRIDNALKKEAKVDELKAKHNITGTKEEQKELVNEKLIEAKENV